MLHRIGLTLAALLVAAPAWASGLDLIKQGQAAEKANNHNQAIEAYSQATAASDLNDNQRALAFYRLGSIRGFLGENVKGVEDFSNSIRLNPNYGYAYSLRGYLRGTIGQYDLAEADHLKAIELAKNETWDGYLPWVLQHYADLWRRRGEFDKALDSCKRALENKDYPSVYFRRAWIYLDMGRKQKAKADFSKFEQEMKRQNVSYSVFWPDERGAISRLRELP